MEFLQFEELVKERRSCRDFNDVPLDREEVLRLAKIAGLSPSACNSQPWHFYCVTSEDKVAAVREALTDGGKNAFLSGAKAFIVAAEKTMPLKADVSARFSSDKFVKYDIGEAVAYMTLAAKARGIESCIIGWINPQKLRAAVGFADNEDCSVVVALGYSDAPVKEKIRRNIEEVISEI